MQMVDVYPIGPDVEVDLPELDGFARLVYWYEEEEGYSGSASIISTEDYCVEELSR
jgi:hypothetical protein